MKSYHFNIGDSGAGPIGFCARVLAESEAEAVAVLQEAIRAIESEHNVFDDTVDDPEEAPTVGLEYIRVYFNADHINPTMIDESEERDEDGMPIEKEDDEQ